MTDPFYGDQLEAVRGLPVSTLCTGRTVVSINRDDALFAFYSAERRAGADPLLANERMHFFAKRLDDDAFERDLDIIRKCIGVK